MAGTCAAAADVYGEAAALANGMQRIPDGFPCGAWESDINCRGSLNRSSSGQSQIKEECTLAPGGLFAVFVVDGGKIDIGRDGCGQKAANKVTDVLWVAHELLEKGVVRVGATPPLLFSMIMGDVYQRSERPSSIMWVSFYVHT
jgi:hypothetical protein